MGAKWMQFIPIVERATSRHDRRSPTWAGASSPAASACSTRSPATSSPSARSAANNTAVPRGYLRGMGAPRRGPCLRPDVRRDARGLLRAPPAVHPRSHLRIRSRAGVQRRSSTPAIISSSRAIKLGNIHETHLLKLVASAAQRKFGDDKRDSLTRAVPALRGQAAL